MTQIYTTIYEWSNKEEESYKYMQECMEKDKGTDALSYAEEFIDNAHDIETNVHLLYGNDVLVARDKHGYCLIYNDKGGFRLIITKKIY